MTNGKLVSVLGEEPRTPLDVAVRNTLAGIGCLPGGSGDLNLPVHGQSGRLTPPAASSPR